MNSWINLLVQYRRLYVHAHVGYNINDLVYTEPLSGQTVAQWADDEKAELGTSNSQRPEQGSNDDCVNVNVTIMNIEQESLRSLARERWFLLRLKSKYAGTYVQQCYTCVYSVRNVNSI